MQQQQSSGPTTPISPDEMLSALNSSFDYGRDRRGMAVLVGITPAKPEEYALAGQAFRRRLQQYVDLWLESGCDEDGAERPATRKPMMDIAGIVGGYLRTHPALPVRFESGYRVAIPFRIESLPSVQLKRPARYQDTPWGKRVRVVEGKHQPANDVLEHAQQLFVGMLFTEWSLRIAKCRRPQCGVYYMLNKPRALYKRGTFCRRCSSLRSAAERTKLRRREQHQERLLIATAAYKTWQQQYRQGQKRRLGALTTYVSAKLKQRNHGCEPKWVTRNMKQIEIMATTKTTSRSIEQG